MLLNRLASAAESGGTNEWSQNYQYDSYGNRWVRASAGLPYNSFTPTVSTNFDGKNRLQIQDSQYDNDGNQTAMGGYSFTYDAENRLIGSYLGGNGTDISNSAYVYDGQGQRVQKIICPADPTNPAQSGPQPCTAVTAGADTAAYVYDVFGNKTAEYESSTKNQWSACGTPTCYLLVDQIGSTRLVTDSKGNVAQRYDYLPFGEELWAGYGGRATDMGYEAAPDGFNPKFTGKDRDTETGIDYFGVRYFSGAQGRFTSPDEPLADQTQGNPQGWNLYSYARNNPLRYTDPTGRKCVDTSNGPADDGTGGGCEAAGVDANGKITPQQVTVGVGRDEANLIMLSMIGEQFSSPHQLAQFASDAAQAAGRLTGATDVAQCLTSGITGSSCSETGLAMAMLPHIPGTGFVTGEVLKRVVQTPQGPLVISAIVEVIGDTIKLKSFSFAHEEGIGVLTNPGPGTLKAALDALKGELAAAGFSKAEITALRITGANSPRLIKKTIDLK